MGPHVGARSARVFLHDANTAELIVRHVDKLFGAIPNKSEAGKQRLM